MDFSELIAAADPSIFTESIKAWVSGLNINSVIMLIMMIFMIVGAIDRIRGNKLGYGEKFEDGFNAIGGLAIAMAGGLHRHRQPHRPEPGALRCNF